MDWMAALDIKRALQNCHVDMVGDWYRDPWGWPELDWLVKKKKTELITARLNSSGVRRVARIDVAKENFGTRPAVVLDPLDRLIYQALVDRLSASLQASTRDWVYGWRLPRKDPRPGRMARNDYEWESYRGHLQQLTVWYGAALKTDVVQCFPSIPVEGVSEMVMTAGGDTKPAKRLVDMLKGWDRVPNRSGLPQRSMASAVLANAYLRCVDDVLVQYERPSKVMSSRLDVGLACRWMDDIWLFGRSAGKLRKAQIEIQSALRDHGLEMNLGKTDVLEEPNLSQQVAQMEHSGVESAMKAGDLGPLDELIDEVTERPEHAERTTLRFLSARMRSFQEFGRAAEIAEEAGRMPQGADHLSRLFRAAETWRDMGDWYVTYWRSGWGSMQWGVAQMGTMFPASEEASSTVRNMFEEVVNGAVSDVALLAVAAHRLAAWDKDAIRYALREASEREENPIKRRVLALAGLAAGETRTTLRRVLGEFEENGVTLAMMEDQNFAKLPTKKDFD